MYSSSRHMTRLLRREIIAYEPTNVIFRFSIVRFSILIGTVLLIVDRVRLWVHKGLLYLLLLLKVILIKIVYTGH